MRPSILLTMLLSALCVVASGCAGVSGCPTCGTTTGGAYADIVNIPVPEHNPTGEPGGPFNSFDISWVDPVHHLDYVSDRIGLAVVVADTVNNIAVNAIQGQNAVTAAGDEASPCDPSIPPIVSVFGNFTRYGCRNKPFQLVSGFGPSGLFGGFPGAQCCAARANGVNPMSGPDGEAVTPDGKFLFTGNGSAHVVVFDLTTMDLTQSPPTPPTVVATIPTGVAADYDGPLGIAPCVASWNGEAGSAADCGDDRADELAYDPVHQVLAVIDGDPGLPFVTFIDMSHIVNKTGTLAQQHCLPIDNTTDFPALPATLPYGPYAATSQLAALGAPPYPSQGLSQTWVIPQAGASFNPPTCIIGQIYYDGAGGAASAGVGLTATVPVDNVGTTFPCPDPTNPSTFGGVSGSAASLVPGIGVTPPPPVGSGTSYTIPCHHGPIVSIQNSTLGTFCNTAALGTQAAPGPFCTGALAPAGLGGMAWNPNTGHLLQTNPNSIVACVSPSPCPATAIGSVDEIDPGLTDTSCADTPTNVQNYPNSCGPRVVNSFVMPNCMPTSIVQGPGDNFLVGCADHDGEAFPPNEYVINGTTGAIIAEITQVGGVDEIWYNPGDNKYYTASRDMPNGPVMGVIDAGTNTWLVNVPTNTNSHSIAVDPSNNHAFVPMQSGGICGTQSSNGCIGVFAQQ